MYFRDNNHAIGRLGTEMKTRSPGEMTKPFGVWNNHDCLECATITATAVEKRKEIQGRLKLNPV